MNVLTLEKIAKSHDFIAPQDESVNTGIAVQEVPEPVLTLRPYKNVVPCGGYRMTGGGVIGDSVIDITDISDKNVIVLSSELLKKSEDDMYYDVKFSVDTMFNVYKTLMILIRENINDNNLQEIFLKHSSSLINKGKVLNYKDFINILLHPFGLDCDGILVGNNETIVQIYRNCVEEIRALINFDDLLMKMVCTLSIRTDLGGKSITIDSNNIYYYPSPLPSAENNFVYFGENGNVVHAKVIE